MRRTSLLSISIALVLACSGGEKPKGDAAQAPGSQPAAAGSSGASGMQIEHVVEGSGASPVASDVVVVHYTGTFPDGTVFDSSVQRGQPAVFPLNRVIPCWTQGLQQMKVGGKAKLTCGP